MHLLFKSIFILLTLGLFNCSINAQVDDICSEAGYIPSFDSPFNPVPYIFGKVKIQGLANGAKMPNVTVSLINSQQNSNRLSLNKSGNYCFKTRGAGGTIIIEVNGMETARRSLPAFGPAQQREDFEIQMTQGQPISPPGVVSAKFIHPPNPKTAELYKKLIEGENKKDRWNSIEILKEIVSADPTDFIAWAKLGELYSDKNLLPEAEAALRKSLELKPEYTTAWISVGIIRLAQKQYEAAVEILKHTATLDPTFARTLQLLGEAYLMLKQGTAGAEALNQAIKLDPIGMAQCHLQLAHLYELAGAKQLATKEYKAFLIKVPEHPEKKKFEKFIRDNPE